MHHYYAHYYGQERGKLLGALIAGCKEATPPLRRVSKGLEVVWWSRLGGRLEIRGKKAEIYAEKEGIR